MGKKYNTVTATVRPIATEEVAFLVEAWEGIKPSRKVALTVRVARETERPANWRPKTDKQGKRPVVSARTEILKSAWKVVGAVHTHGERISLFESDAGYCIERVAVGRRYGAKVETFSSIEEVQYGVRQYEYGCMGKCAAVINLFERLVTSHSYEIDCTCNLCVSGRDEYQREFDFCLELQISSTNGTGHSWMYRGWGCPTCRK